MRGYLNQKHQGIVLKAKRIKERKKTIIRPYWVEYVIVVHINTPRFNIDDIYYTLIAIWRDSYLIIYI